MFGLEALFDQDPVCSTGHATTPRRRQFNLIQQTITTKEASLSGGFAAATFERTGLSGIKRSYAVFPEMLDQTGVARPQFNGRAYVYVHEACSEYTNLDFVTLEFNFKNRYAGVFEPLPANGVPKFCPYSVTPEHFLAWENFRTFYNPVSPCKGLSADPTREANTTIPINFYTQAPPAAMLERSTTIPQNWATIYSRAASPGSTSTNFFTVADYTDLHSRRDDTMFFLQVCERALYCSTIGEEDSLQLSADRPQNRTRPLTGKTFASILHQLTTD